MRTIAAVMALLLVPVGAGAADGKVISDCIRKVSVRTFAAGASAELIGAIACAGDTTEYTGEEFDKRVRLIGACVDKVSFSLQTKGGQGETAAATACRGVVDPAETDDCMRRVGFELSATKGGYAQALAATACARGNPAKETAACVREVIRRLSATGAAAEAIAVRACSR